MVSKNTISLWYDGAAEDAARCYARTFPDGAMETIRRAPGDYLAGKQDDVSAVEFAVSASLAWGLNGGPGISRNEAFLFRVATDGQAETDRLWKSIINGGGRQSGCGWCKDTWSPRCRSRTGAYGRVAALHRWLLPGWSGCTDFVG